MSTFSLYHTFQRYRTLQTDRIRALPIVILMPHSACNCKCVMCDIWKGNHNLKQLTEEDIKGLLDSLRRLGTRQVLMSGGEALLNPNFFRFCGILAEEKIKITLLSTGLSLKRHAANLVRYVEEIIVSLDGDESLHDTIRNIPGAFGKLREGITAIRALSPDFRITARTVIHRLNFRRWSDIIRAAADLGLDQISFLPADVSSEAFNRANPWDEPRQHEILPSKEELPELLGVIRELIQEHKDYFETRFIAESPEKIGKIGAYYTAAYGMNPYPYKKCNAPWVSTVVEADGTVRPCFFLPPLGNIHQDSLENILNSRESLQFRKTLDMDMNSTCIKCVCYLNLSPHA
ncbi:MAG TPA: radical SAM protein [Puia sp.]|jgi:MoaA/NifB/PqqE/SkfB family radical SAM enzyme